jgi:hypothetical protein
MKAIRLCLIIFIGAVIINFLRDGATFHIAKTLPFANGPERIGLYDYAGVAAMAIVAWGLYRLNRKNGDE